MSRVPRITVAIPFFDEEPWLAAAIRAVLAQTMRDFELLLVDDGSRDRSLEIARSFADPRIVVVSDGQRRHLPARLNEIARRARAPLVARMDADDVVHPERLARQLALLDSGPHLDAVGTWLGLIGADGEVFGVVESVRLPAPPSTALERALLPHASLLARRSWLLEHPYDETLTRAEDRDLWCRTVASARLAAVPLPLYVVRITARDERFIEDYVEAQRQNRTLYRRYGPSLVGWPRTARLSLESLAKASVMRLATAIGSADRLVRRRGRSPTSEERRWIDEALASGRGEPHPQGDQRA